MTRRKPSLTAKRSASVSRMLALAAATYRKARQLEGAGKRKEATALYQKADRLLARATSSGKHTEGPVGILPNPKKRRPNPPGLMDEGEDWYDIEEESMRLGTQQARALGRSEREHRARAKFYKVTWYSPLRNKRTGFAMPIEAHTAMDAKRQAKAMVTNDPKANNFVAKEAKVNPAASDSSVRSPTRTSTEVRSPTKTSTWANTRGNITVTGGAGAGATTRVTVRRNPAAKKVECAACGRKFLASTRMVCPDCGSSKRKRNPSVTQLAETFQGRASGAVSKFKAANAAPSDLARIGKLVFLKLAGSRAQTRVPGAMVAVDKGGKLWIVGNRTPLFSRKAKPGEALDFGFIDKLCYLTAKAHIESGKLTEYVHLFGEEGGKRPRLLIDSEGMPILRGGDYKIKSAGITD